MDAFFLEMAVPAVVDPSGTVTGEGSKTNEQSYREGVEPGGLTGAGCTWARPRGQRVAAQSSRGIPFQHREVKHVRKPRTQMAELPLTHSWGGAMTFHLH